MTHWHPNYQPRDWTLVDYQEFRLAGCDVPFRGPGFDPFKSEPGAYFTCLGAAQTYGCFFERPFPTILSETLNLPVLNLAVGGAGPGFYTQFDCLTAAINRGRFAILQCMSGRSESNTKFAADGYVEYVRERATGAVMTSSEAWHRICAEDLASVEQLVAETRRSWIESSHRLLAAIKVPVAFFWFSRRTPDYTVNYEAIDLQLKQRQAGAQTSFFVDGLMGDFPQLIDEATMRAVAGSCAAYAECLSGRGMNQPLINRFTGEPFSDTGLNMGPEYKIDYTRNTYYPSPEMHQDAAASLLPVIAALPPRTNQIGGRTPW
jgi:hypothetical protein